MRGRNPEPLVQKSLDLSRNLDELENESQLAEKWVNLAVKCKFQSVFS